ncbi:DUF6223 family protein [Nonomuraea zeae]|uniref:Uncharacterized protein n=1 Tax=Nonomuraea zeae TaxID=1642303 RepID=A0A5S4G1L8_9ACTN|nr:DUF6223 family protein [Nonomuraea zeae]TMR26893.1 hypothetical protein ETD85_41010 [Nonomuraea zeae]
MSARSVLTVAAATLTGGIAFAAPAAARVSVQLDPAGAYALTSGRIWSLVAALLGLAGVVAGGLALARSAGRFRTRTGTGTGRNGAVVALVAGPAGMVIGGLVVAAAKGGPGTGYGIVGGFVALVVGLISVVVGGLALARSRRRSGHDASRTA